MNESPRKLPPPKPATESVTWVKLFSILIGIKRAGEQGERIKHAFDRLRDELRAVRRMQ